MLKTIRKFKRASLVATSLFLATVTAVPALLTASASAVGGQVTVRSITMSSSKPGASSVTYTVKFTPATSITNPDVIIDFCSNSPLIGDTCTATAGTDTPNMTSAAATGWTVTPIGSNRGIKLTTTTNSFTAGTPATITVTGVTNQTNVGSPTGTFYGRILTYATGGAGSNTSASPGTYTDYGGVALSVVNNITITSKVFETLSFCVYTGSCGSSAPSITLGDATTGALSSSSTYINTSVLYSLATNASPASGNSLTVSMTGQTLCRAATLSFANCPTGASSSTITAMGTTPQIVTSGTYGVGNEAFGMCVNKGGSAALTTGTAYTDSINGCPTTGTSTYSGTSKFGFDDTNTTGTNSSAGSTVLTATGAVPSMSGNFAFVGNIAPTTEAGIYQSVLNLVASASF